ncbi:heavy-metal-associated domain-containing protein [Bacillus sp. FJAT-27251]|uniref:heavy-metal-associated domain-containing protein n=1 Tax=Bacillus sp. FJAT-27251 TaxID=1684142 RepID=UPI0006A77DAB|nr:heavy-metal-associated domain-containing protein [Bacillus sp. FJAT-27251]
MSKAVFQLEPLTCPSCIKKIESKLSKTVGVDSAAVLFISRKVKAVYDESQINAGELEEIIKKLGYEVLSAKVS